MRSLIDSGRIDLRDLQEKFVDEYLSSREKWSASSLKSVSRLHAKGDNYLTSGIQKVITNGYLARLAPIAMYYASRNLKTYPLDRRIYEIERLVRMTHNDTLCVIIGSTYAMFLEMIMRRGFTDTYEIPSSLKKVMVMQIYAHAVSIEKYFHYRHKIVSNMLEKLIDNFEDLNTNIVAELIVDCSDDSLVSFVVVLLSWCTSNIDCSDIPFANNLTMERYHSGSVVGAVVGAVRGLSEFPEELRNRLSRYSEIQELAPQFLLLLEDKKVPSIFYDLEPFKKHYNIIDELYDEAVEQSVYLDNPHENAKPFTHSLLEVHIFSRLVYFAHSWEAYILNPFFRSSLFRREAYLKYTHNFVWDDPSQNFIEEVYQKPYEKAKKTVLSLVRKATNGVRSAAIGGVLGLISWTPAVASMVLFFGFAQIFNMSSELKLRGMAVSLPGPGTEEQYVEQLKLDQTF